MNKRKITITNEEKKYLIGGLTEELRVIRNKEISMMNLLIKLAESDAEVTLDEYETSDLMSLNELLRDEKFLDDVEKSLVKKLG